MGEQSNDENNVAASSTATDGTTSNASSETSTSHDENRGETMADAMLDAFKKSTGSDSSTAEEKTEDSPVLNKHETKAEGEQTKEEKKVDGTEEAVVPVTEEEPAKKESFQDHPDWKKMVETKNTFEAKVKELEPLAKAHMEFAEYWERNNINADQFKEIVRFGTLLYTDPLKFKEEFTETWKQLSGLTGDELPSDLQAQLDGIDEELDSGTLTKVRADQLKANVRDIAKLRGQESIRKTRTELDQKRQQENQQRQFQQEVTTTVRSWVEGKQKTDVSFAQAKDGSNGRYELTMQLVKSYALESPPRTTADVVKLLEKAYTAMSGFASNGKPKVNSKVITSTRSSITNNKTEPKDMKSAMLQAAAAHGVRG